MRSFAGELDFWHFDANLMVFKDGSLGAGFKLAGVRHDLCDRAGNQSAEQGFRKPAQHRR